MAEVNGAAQRGSGNVRRRGSIKIDMTPMVDLGFLLITFFMLTAVLTKPCVFPVEKYTDKDDDSRHRKTLQEKNLMTLVLGENNKVYWFIGTTEPKVEVTNYSSAGIRKVLFSKKAEIKDLFVFIKPSTRSRYQNLVDILDEMNIAEISRYSIMDVTAEDNAVLPK